MIKIIFRNHYGELDLETDNVIFYGLYFDTILEAMKFLVDGLVPNLEYEPCYLRGLRCVRRPSDGWIFTKGQWWESEETILKVLFD